MALNSGFIKEYLDLLIFQYIDKPKAKADIETIAGQFGRVFDFYNSFFDAFDIDQATGDQLDIIGKIVGLPRSVPFVLAKNRFGFDGDTSARGMADFFDDSIESAPFYDFYEAEYTSQQLDDFDYRFFIKAKISQNVVSAYMINHIERDRISLQDIIIYLFGSDAYLIDNQNMTMALYVGLSVDEQRLILINQLGLLPRPQGVSYSVIAQGGLDAFGFQDDPNALGFGELSDPSIGGVLTNIIL